MSSKRSLAQWLSYIEHAHTQSIDMSLTRIRKVFVLLKAMLEQQQSPDLHSIKPKCLISVAGTNGKGSTCRFIEQACVEAGYSVGVYASPHILRFNERVRINGLEASDEQICEAFERTEQARLLANEQAQIQNEQAISLSYFEYATLCGFTLFMLNKVDFWVLEVGLGGRLDATNIIDADIGVITSIGLDHQAYLGDTTELIAAEKAGIIKPQQNVIIGYPDPHKSVINIAQQQNAKLKISGLDFGLHKMLNDSQVTNTTGWLTLSGKQLSFDLSKAHLPQQNIMTAIACLNQVARHINHSEKLLLSTDNIQALINSVQMPGRFQVLQRSPTIIVDVAHNQAACDYLFERLQTISYSRCHIVVGMLKDKNIEASLAALREINPTWYCTSISADISAGRGENAERLQAAVSAFGQTASCFDNVAAGMQAAMKNTQANDLILVMGSFIVASECMQFINSNNKGEMK